MALSEERPLLLDVNALLALAWPNHQFHDAVVERLERQPASLWATCALTQLGFVRLSSNPKVVEVRKNAAERFVFWRISLVIHSMSFSRPCRRCPRLRTYFVSFRGTSR